MRSCASDGVGERLTIDVIDDSDLSDNVDLPGGVDDIQAVALVITGVQSRGPGSGFVTAYPSGTERPLASNLNVNQGTDVRANLVVVPVSSEGSVEIYLERVSNVVVDIAGYVTAESALEATDGRFRLIAPTREVDTRSNEGFDRFAAGDTRSIDYVSVPAEARGVAHNLTMARTGARWYVSAGPVVNQSPEFSSVDAAGPGLVRAAMNIVDLGNASTDHLSAGDVLIPASPGSDDTTALNVVVVAA